MGSLARIAHGCRHIAEVDGSGNSGERMCARESGDVCTASAGRKEEAAWKEGVDTAATGGISAG